MAPGGVAQEAASGDVYYFTNTKDEYTDIRKTIMPSHHLVDNKLHSYCVITLVNVANSRHSLNFECPVLPSFLKYNVFMSEQ